MNPRFQLSGPLTEISSYPQWAQDMVADCDRVKRTVTDHELWDRMRTNTLGVDGMANFMIGIWPVIERFPGYMAQSLLKTRFGRSEGDNLARRWLDRVGREGDVRRGSMMDAEVEDVVTRAVRESRTRS